MKVNMKNNSHRQDINKRRPRQRLRYTNNVKCASV